MSNSLDTILPVLTPVATQGQKLVFRWARWPSLRHLFSKQTLHGGMDPGHQCNILSCSVSVIAQSRTSLVVWKVKEFKMISTEF
jgi:hypothetical protein